MMNDKKINDDIERFEPTGDPRKIVPFITPRMHPLEPTLAVEAYGVPSGYFAAGGSHTFLVTVDRSITWGNAGRNWWDTAEGEEQTRVRVAEQDIYYDWLMEFSPPLHDNFWKTGINFGFNGVCHTITNRQLLLGEKFATVSKAAKAYLTTAIFGLYGLGLDDLRERLINSYNSTQHLTKLPDGTLEKVLAKIDYAPEIDIEAWADTLQDISAIPMGVFLVQYPELKGVLMNRIAIYRKKSEETYIKAMKEQWLQTRYQQTLIALLLDLNDNFANDLVAHNIVTQDIATKYIDTGTESILQMLNGALAQHEIVAQQGAMDDNLADHPDANYNLIINLGNL